MTPAQLRLRAFTRGAAALAAFAAALFLIVIAFYVPLLGVALATVLWGLVIRGQMWRF
jgi:hypothetical protein